MKNLTYVFKWFLAILISFALINVICFFYERQGGWRDTPNGATLAVREPYSVLVHGTEGYSITIVDKNGYLNPDKELADEYVLIMGSSHTQGKEVSPDKKFSVLINDSYGDDKYLHTYNIACDGSYLPTQIKYFKAALEAFPGASIVVIEIASTAFDTSVLEQSLNQPEYDPLDSAVWFENMSITDKIRSAVKDYIPMLSKIKRNYMTIKEAKAVQVKQPIDLDEYRIVINKALQLIRSETDVPIVFVYHPGVIVNYDGSVTLGYSETNDIFEDACLQNGIDVIDTGEAFLECYENSKELPYGFSNTTLGTGHLNATGHKIIADEIIEYLEVQR